MSERGAGVQIGTLAKVVRSKNAGPFQLTIDFLFPDRDAFDQVVRSGALTPQAVAEAYGLPLDRVEGVYFWEAALAVKVTLKRDVSAGAPGDRDCYGAQQHAPLLPLLIRTPEPVVALSGR